MDTVREQDRRKRDDIKTLLAVTALFFTIVLSGIFVFLHYYDLFIDGILYRERLNQMREVTMQLFTGLEDVVQNRWDNTVSYCNYLQAEQPQTADALSAFMEVQAERNGLEQKGEKLVAVDELGRCRTHDGSCGVMEEMNLLLDRPERIGFVSKSMTSGETYLYFLRRMDEPVSVRDGSRTVRVIYYGMAQNMENLNPYFACEAYDNSNSVYVLDSHGMRLFRSENSGVLSGYNAFATLQGMRYLHGNSFEEAKRELDATGHGYANAVLDGEEYYYALYRMEHAEWTVLFLVPSSHVAAEVVTMVNTTVKMILIFAVILLAVSSFVIVSILRRKRIQAVEAERRNSESLAKVNAELSVAVKTAERAEQAAKDANRAKSNFLANMSHDIRTPMNAIVGLTKLMEYDGDDPQKMKGYLRKMQGSSRHLLSLINDVLDMSKIESGEIALGREPIGLAEQLTQVDGMIRPQAEERNQKFTVRTCGIKHEHLLGDAVRLRQIFINLLSNAVKYTQNGGTVDLEVAELPSGNENRAVIAITVTDNGCGMSPDVAEHMYEPFTRAENSTTNRVQGTGLGMAITKNIVDLMGGEIEVQSEPGRGTCFHVTLPFEIDALSGRKPTDPTADDRANSRSCEDKQENNSALVGKRLLCAEDNELNAEILEALLERNGASCVMYPDGQKLLAAFAESKPGDFDAVLMDMQMPVMNGLEAARAIREGKNPLGRSIPIVAMTANAFSSDVQRCLDAGMDAHVAKPIDIEVLKRTLENLLSPHHTDGD